MSVVVPEPIPLDMPPGDPAALEDFVEDVAGAGYRLGRRSPPACPSSAASAPHWRGSGRHPPRRLRWPWWPGSPGRSPARSLTAAAPAAGPPRPPAPDPSADRRAQGRSRTRTSPSPGARLSRSRYHDRRWQSALEAAAVVEDSRRPRRRGRREHAALLEELADDAAAAARALADACRPVGGTGGRERLRARGRPPGGAAAGLGRPRSWLRRGEDLAEAHVDGLVSPEEMRDARRGGRSLMPDGGLRGGLPHRPGEDGVRDAADRPRATAPSGRRAPLARVLALALGAAVPEPATGDPVGDVLTATYIDRGRRHEDAGLMAVGMATVLAGRARAGAAGCGRRPSRPGRARCSRGSERQGMRRPVAPVDRAARDRDAPIATHSRSCSSVARRRAASPGAAAGLLADRETWDVAPLPLVGGRRRQRSDGVDRTRRNGDRPVGGTRPSRPGSRRSATGLTEAAIPTDWTVDRTTAAAVCAAASGARWPCTSRSSTVPAAGQPTGGGPATDGDALRGLGYLTLDDERPRRVERGAARAGRATEPTADGPARVGPSLPSRYRAPTSRSSE